MMGPGILAEDALVQIDASIAPSADAIARSLRKRPSMDILKEKGIIKTSAATGHVVSPQLAESMARHDRSLKMDQLARSLDKRPTVDDLKERGIIQDAGQLDSCGGAFEASEIRSG